MIAKRFDGAIFILYNAASMKMFWKDIFAFGWLAAVRSVFTLAVLGGGALAEENSFAKINWKTVTPAELDAAIADGKLDANAPFGDGDFPPLWHAVSKSDNLDLLDVLVRHGAEINQTSTTLGMAALHLAAYQGRVPQMRRLLELGADVHLRDADGTGELIITYPLHNKGEYYQSAEQRKAALDVLLKHGADLHFRPLLRDKISPGIMAHAVAPQCQGDLDTYNGILSYLASLGADVNYHPSASRASAIHFAVVACKLEDGVLQELVSLGGDVNLTGEFGVTPLMWFAQGGRDIAVFDYLLKKGANLDAKSKNAWSVLTYARNRDMATALAFSDSEEEFIAFGDKIIARIESLCENREYEVCAELDEDFEAGDSVKLSDILNDGKEG